MTSVESTTAGATFGNIIAGGIIGAAVDMSSGAAYQYPPQITVSLVKADEFVPPKRVDREEKAKDEEQEYSTENVRH